MAINYWKVRSYNVFLHQGGVGEAEAERRLTVMNASASIHVDISFRDTTGGLGHVALLPPSAPFREHVRTTWPVSRYREAYELLRSEDPVFMGYSWAPDDEDPDATFGVLLQIALSTDAQPWWES
jgi:hypothetical protein